MLNNRNLLKPESDKALENEVKAILAQEKGFLEENYKFVIDTIRTCVNQYLLGKGNFFTMACAIDDALSKINCSEEQSMRIGCQLVEIPTIIKAENNITKGELVNFIHSDDERELENSIKKILLDEKDFTEECQNNVIHAAKTWINLYLLENNDNGLLLLEKSLSLSGISEKEVVRIANKLIDQDIVCKILQMVEKDDEDKAYDKAISQILTKEKINESLHEKITLGATAAINMMIDHGGEHKMTNALKANALSRIKNKLIEMDISESDSDRISRLIYQYNIKAANQLIKEDQIKRINMLNTQILKFFVELSDIEQNINALSSEESAEIATPSSKKSESSPLAKSMHEIFRSKTPLPSPKPTSEDLSPSKRASLS